MKPLFVSNQRGAVLIFSLIMLLLLTLVSVSMIQQNKQELAMTGNTLEQTKTLARAESELKQAEQAVNAKRLDRDAATTGIQTNNDNKCNSSSASQLNKNQVILTTTTGTATVTAFSCLTSNIETQCTYTSGVRNDTAACKCSSNGGTEIYVIKWESTADANYGAQRTVESKYAVDCSGGQFP